MTLGNPEFKSDKLELLGAEISKYFGCFMAFPDCILKS